MEDKLIVLPDIEFEGKIIKAKGGYYKCPFNCGNSGYPKPKWKTEKGFRTHLEKCNKSTSKVKEKIDAQNERTLKIEELKKQCIENGLIPVELGQKIYYHGYYVVKPTHEQRFNRMVRVRYDEVRSYFAKEDTIKFFDLDIPYYYSTFEDLNTIIKRFLVINRTVTLSQLCSSLEEAQKISREQQKNYNESCEDATRFR